MKRYLTTLLLLLCTFTIYAQQINYQKTLSDALSLAAKSHKPVFILITVPSSILPGVKSIIPSSIIPSLESKDVVKFYNAKFVNYRADMRDTVVAALRNKYNITRFPAYLFIDVQGHIINKAADATLSPQMLIKVGQTTLMRIAKGKTIYDFKKLNNQDKLTRAQLKEYISLREDMGFIDNAALIDKYAGKLTGNELSDYNEVLFILKAGPYAFGKTYNLIYANPKMPDSVFKHEPLEVRKDINSRLIINTRNEAIRTKNIIMANFAANISASSWSPNYTQGYKSSAESMIIYYKAVKDTVAYYNATQYLYDNYLSLTADSVKKLKVRHDEKISERKVITKPGQTNQYVVTTTMVSAPGFDVAAYLNNAAWDFYTMGTHNSIYLFKALAWSHRSIELEPGIPGYYDTLAHILYRLNFYDDAILNQTKAIKMAENSPLYYNERYALQIELENMKQRML